MASTALMAFAITVTIFSGDADNVRITHHDVLSLDDCAQWQQLFKNEKTKAVDPTGRQIIIRRYECVPMKPTEMQAILDRSAKRYPNR